MKTRFALTFALLLPALPALADDQANAAQTSLLAASCANCHGTDGKLAGVIPAIANRPATALENQLMEFKHSDSTRATVMPRIAKGYSDDELKALAQYFSRIGSAQQR
ncbi:c-type cytochrome [Marinobacter shengliensis]|uniref:c-type cytochrome n=1 Tax=Marinobacter shengliensis TaxID=1389223 RepID=UPI001109A668|nr:c-type cytochrome [Marinobacter shengliensis]